MEIAITGAGIICAIGNDKQQVLESLRKGESGIGTMKYLSSKHLELPVGEVKLSNAEMAAMLSLDADYSHSRTSLMGAIAVRQALAQAGFSPDGTHWKGLEGKKVVLISGTTVGTNVEKAPWRLRKCPACRRNVVPFRQPVPQP